MKTCSRGLLIAAFAAASFASGVAHSQEPSGGAQLPDPQIKADQIQKEVADIRGLPFKRNVKAQVQNMNDFGTYLDRAIESEVPQNYKQNFGKVVRKLGLYNGPIIENVPDMMKMIMTSQAGAYYDPDKQTFFVLMTKIPEMMLDSLYAHELYHGLQDQYFDLNKYFLHAARSRQMNSDESMARQAVVEGEATYMMTLWLMKRMTGSIPSRDIMSPAINMQVNMDMEMLRSAMKAPELADLIGEDMKTAMAAVDKIPPFLFDALMGSYMKGLGFVYAVQDRGWPEVEKLYGNKPPLSTEQILHPEKWFANEGPTAIKFAAYSDRRLNGWELLDEDVLGEFRWRSVFKAQGLGAEANDLAAGWGGDRYAVMKKKGADDLLLLLYTTWDSEAEATQFASGYGKLLATKYANAKEPTRVVQKKTAVLIAEGGNDAQLNSLIDWLAEAKLGKAN